MNNNLTTQKLAFAPKGHNCGANEDAFLTKAFQQGYVLSPEEFAHKWSAEGGNFFADYDLRLMDVYNTCWELCPECECEVELLTKWETQTCPVCGRAIAPCNLCFPYDCDCNNCPLSKECDRINKERDDFWAFKHNVVRCTRQAIDKVTDDNNVIDIRIHRYPYHPVNDIEIFSIAPLDHQAMWDFVKDADEWYLDFYENFAGENYAEFMDISVASWANE